MPQRTPIWTAIAHSLRSDIAAGVYGPDDKLPTESALAARFGVNRHTVRHAIKALAGEGLVLPRRGAGVFVTSTPTDYPIGRRVRFHQNLSAQGLRLRKVASDSAPEIVRGQITQIAAEYGFQISQSSVNGGNSGGLHEVYTYQVCRFEKSLRPLKQLTVSSRVALF